MSRSDHLNKQQLSELRQLLRKEKAQIEKRLAAHDHAGLELAEREMTGELSTSDNHPADVATDVYEREKDMALQDHAAEGLAQINEALDRMTKGQYGSCKTCGEPIAFERLSAVPTAQYCKQHAEDNGEMSTRERPVEEEFLHPPFGRTSMDEHDEANFFDGEDAWQIVASWGTSDSPAMAEHPDVQSDYDHMFIEADELDGYVESLESFIATDLYGNPLPIIKNRQYNKYMASDEGDHYLEVGRDMMDDDA